jgi:AraC-like DNA-binding protein
MVIPLEVSTAYARLTLQSKLLPVDGLLEGTGVTAEFLMSADYIDGSKLAAIFHNIDKQQGVSPAWAARLGGQFSASAHGPLGFAALSAPTLGAAVEALAEFYPARVNAIATELELVAGRYVWHVLDVTGDADFARSLAEIVLKVVESLLAAILGHPVGDNVVVSLTRPEPAAADEFIEVYDAHVVFGATSNSISIPAIWWRLPSPLYDESMYWANIAKCRELITSREQLSSAAVIVRTHLRIHFDRQIAGDSDPVPPPTLEAVAAAMHLTTRTLIRRLKKEDTAYKEILEELRRDYAQTLLGNARLTVADISELLGYKEPANFGRAFRRWFGRSPAHWRRRSSRE